MSMLTRLCMSLVVAAAFVATPVLAQPNPNSHEVSGSASFFRPTGAGTGAFNLDAAYGYYFDNPSWEVGIRQGYTLNYNRHERDVWNAVTSPYLNYNFIGDFLGMEYDNMLVPYLGAFVGAVWNDEDFTGTVGPQTGIKAYFTPSTFLRLQYRYEWFFDELETADDFQDSNHVVTIGFGYNWGGTQQGSTSRS